MNRLGVCRNVAFAALMGTYGAWHAATLHASDYNCGPFWVDYYGSEIVCAEWDDARCTTLCSLCNFGTGYNPHQCTDGEHINCACL